MLNLSPQLLQGFEIPQQCPFHVRQRQPSEHSTLPIVSRVNLWLARVMLCKIGSRNQGRIWWALLRHG
eukprot:CAMPEP_0115069860 /NCGR_PEP_ID=MMETSP0227-20121206/12792_1 /TAXON_ID=89957 /ORGANISM="Polarella glacialis, Strain CCMP 1383" /LENGTH=67 /DNA_ID=CAMNT_0002456309 /DNA_START=323 /DNA_END=526 /DNA_ORIENTATION=+